MGRTNNSLEICDYSSIFKRFIEETEENKQQVRDEILSNYDRDGGPRALILEDVSFNTEEFMLMIQLLSDAKQLEELSLFNNAFDFLIDDELMPGIQTLTALEELSICGNPLTDHSAETISAFLAANPALTHLTLKDAAFTHKGATELFEVLLSNPKLQLRELKLKACSFNNKSAELLGQMLSKQVHLEGFDLAKNVLGGDEGVSIQKLLAGLPENAKLKRLNLSFNVLDDADVAVISDNLPNLPNLTHLDLSKNTFSVTALRGLLNTLEHHPKFESLNLGVITADDLAQHISSWQKDHVHHFKINFIPKISTNKQVLFSAPQAAETDKTPSLSLNLRV